jgi:hypothetical protein
MQNPFPGMNPYLEQPELWHQVHNRLIVAIADELTPQIAPQYRVSIEERVYTSTDDILLAEIADIERFLEVKATQSREIVTVIEVISPKNKRSQEGRKVYAIKRQKILASVSNLVEIDLLRLGEILPILGVTKNDYRILVSRSHQRPDADLYGFNLKDNIPSFPVPLCLGETEPVIDLQKLINQIYERARFDLAIDYSQILKPTLSPEQETWVREIVNL